MPGGHICLLHVGQSVFIRIQKLNGPQPFIYDCTYDSLYISDSKQFLRSILDISQTNWNILDKNKLSGRFSDKLFVIASIL